MDVMDENLLNFWKSLNHFNVDYIMVGGLAVNLHGFSRTTNDIDIWIKDVTENRKQLGLVFSQFGYPDINLEKFEFIPGWTDFHIGSGVHLDILINMVGLEGYSFDDCLNKASIAEIENIKIPFLHINQLIANKKAINRPKDQIDVLELEKIKLVREEMGLD
jgi:hypothetical protein